MKTIERGQSIKIEAVRVWESDGSAAYDVLVRQGDQVIRMGAITQKHAERLVTMLAGALESNSIETVKA